MNSEKVVLSSSPSFAQDAANEIDTGMRSLNIAHKQDDLNSRRLTNEVGMEYQYFGTNYGHQALYHQMYEQYIQGEKVPVIDENVQDTHEWIVDESIQKAMGPSAGPSRSTVQVNNHWGYQSIEYSRPVYHDVYDEKSYVDIANISNVSMESGSVASSIQNNQNIPYTSLRAYRQAVEESEDPKFVLDFAKFLVEVADKYSKTNNNAKKIKRNKILLHSEALKWIKGLVGSISGVVKGYPEAQFLLAEWYGSGAVGMSK
jgi:hypothetical protein